MGKDATLFNQPKPAPIFLPTEPLEFSDNRKAIDWSMKELSRIVREIERRRLYGQVEFSMVFNDGHVTGDVRVQQRVDMRV